jgi:Tol biopolymer transport system component
VSLASLLAFVACASPASSQDGAAPAERQPEHDAQEPLDGPRLAVGTPATSLKRLTNDEHREITPRLSPDGNALLMTVLPQVPLDLPPQEWWAAHTASIAKAAIAKLSLDTGERSIITPDSSANAGPCWLPGGDSIIFGTDRASPPTEPHPLPTDWHAYVGTKWLGGINTLVQGSASDAGGAIRFITQPSIGSAESAEVSPDGKTIAFVLAQPGAPWQISLVDITGDNLRTLCEGMWPVWSPDGKRLMFARSPAVGEVRIYSLDVQSPEDIEELTSGHHDKTGNWSPDGSQIVFARQDGQECHVFVMDARDLHVTQVTEGDCICGEPGGEATGSSISRRAVEARRMSGGSGSADAGRAGALALRLVIARLKACA